MEQDKIQKLVAAANSTNALAREIGTKKLAEMGLDKDGKPMKSEVKESKPKKEVKERKPKAKEEKVEKKREEKPKNKVEVKQDEYDCDDIIAKIKARKKKVKELAAKMASMPKKTPATKNKEAIEKTAEKVKHNIEKRVEKDNVSVGEIQKLISEYKDAIKKLEALLIKAKGKMQDGGSIYADDVQSLLREAKGVKDNHCGCHDKMEHGGNVDAKLIDESAKTIYEKEGMMGLRNIFLQVAKTDEENGDKETANYRRKVVSEYQAKQPKFMKQGGGVEYGSMILKYDFPKYKRTVAATVYLKPDTSRIVKVGGRGEKGYTLLYKDGRNSNLVITERQLDQLKEGETIQSSNATVSLSETYAKGGKLVRRGGREYPTGSAWTLEHNSKNKAEKWEQYAEGGKLTQTEISARKWVDDLVNEYGYEKAYNGMYYNVSGRNPYFRESPIWVTAAWQRFKELENKMAEGGGVGNSFNNDVADKMEKIVTMKSFAPKVRSMNQDITYNQLSEFLPDYVSGADIRMVLEESKRKMAEGGGVGLTRADIEILGIPRNRITEKEWKSILSMAKYQSGATFLLKDEKGLDVIPQVEYEWYVKDKYAKGDATPAQKRKVKKVMHEWKEGELNIGKSDKKVKSQKQAVAIALSQAGLSKKAKGGKMIGWKHKAK